MGKTVLHGVDQSGLSTKRPEVGNDGALFYETDGRGQRVWDDAAKAWHPRELFWSYDFAALGGAVGTLPIPGAIVPAGFIVWDGCIDVVTSFTSGGAATVAVQVEAANDIVNAVILGTQWAAGRRAIIPDGTIANSKKATAQRTLSLVIAVQALTAGKCYGFLRLFPSRTS